MSIISPRYLPPAAPTSDGILPTSLATQLVTIVESKFTETVSTNSSSNIENPLPTTHCGATAGGDTLPNRLTDHQSMKTPLTSSALSSINGHVSSDLSPPAFSTLPNRLTDHQSMKTPLASSALSSTNGHVSSDLSPPAFSTLPNRLTDHQSMKTPLASSALSSINSHVSSDLSPPTFSAPAGMPVCHID